MYYQTGHRCSSMLHPRGKYQDAESDTLTSKGGASTHWCKSWTKNWWAQNLQTWFCLPRVLTAPNGYHGQNVLFRKLNTQKELIWVRWLKQGSIFRSIRYPSSASYPDTIWVECKGNSSLGWLKFHQNIPKIYHQLLVPPMLLLGKHVCEILVHSSNAQVLKLSRIKLQFHRSVSVALKHVHGLYKHRQGNMTTWMASLSD